MQFPKQLFNKTNTTFLLANAIKRRYTNSTPYKRAKSGHPSIPMPAHLEVLGAGQEDCSSTVQLFFDDARYLFDCGDGTQRVSTEHGTKFTRLRAIHLTSLSAPSIGGIFGLILTIADAGKQHLTVTAPKGLHALFNASRPFCHRPQLQSTLHEIDLQTAVHKLPILVSNDECVTIHAVPINSRRDIQIDTAFGMHFDALSYICRLHDLRGKFNPQRAIQLGVKKGPQFGLLQKGHSVVTDHGTTVNSSDVMTPTTPGPLVLIIACPSTDHLSSLVNSPALQPAALGLTDSPAPTARKCVMCHFAPHHVLAHTDYREWSDGFGPHVTHISLHASMAVEQTIFTAQAEDIALLHDTVDAEIFPLPFDVFAPTRPEQRGQQPDPQPDPNASSLDDRQGGRDCVESVMEKWVGEWLPAECKLKVTLSPVLQAGVNRSAIRARHIDRKTERVCQDWQNGHPENGSEGSEEARPAGNAMGTPACIKNLPEGTAAVRFFGTGAALPGKHRNVSAIMVDLFSRGGVLLDCGEGTWGQMVRLLGVRDAQRAVGNLRVIFISHMHADHHLGLMTVLHQRSKAIRDMSEVRHGPQLVLIGPRYLQVWLNAFQTAACVPLAMQVRMEDRSYRFFDVQSLTDPQTMESKFFTDTFGIEIGCVEVIHCPESYGIVIRDTVYGWKVVYSGDSRPCAALAEAGRGATLAIHEATLEDGLHQEALEKLHCTTSEALSICSEDMLAWRTILTHFSQRYPKIPRLDDDVVSKLRAGRAAFAFDFMCVDFTRLEHLPKIVPALKNCFAEECEKLVASSNDKKSTGNGRSEE